MVTVTTCEGYSVVGGTPGCAETEGGYLIPPGEPSAEQYCTALNQKAEPGVYYVMEPAELSGWTYINRKTRPRVQLICRVCGKRVSEHRKPQWATCSESGSGERHDD